MPFVGEITPPGDKSVSHRLALMPILGRGEMRVAGLSDCEDVKSSLGVFRALGGQVHGGGAHWLLKGLGGRLNIDPSRPVALDCGNSGTTMRLACGLLAGLPGTFILDGDDQLRRRPMERVADPLRRMGGRLETTAGKPPLTVVGGPLHGLEYTNAEASAQLKSAIIFAGLQAQGPTVIVEPVPTRDHTERILAAWGAPVAIKGQGRVEVAPGPFDLPAEYVVPADPSAAAFFLCGAAMAPGSRVTARNVLLSEGRVGFLKALDRMGADISVSLMSEKPEPWGHVTVAYNGRLQAVAVEPAEVPSMIDEIPILAMAAATAEGESAFRGVRELRVKETDRLTAIKHLLGALGAKARVENDDLYVTGAPSFMAPPSLDSGRDHRIAMALYIALAVAGQKPGAVPVAGDEAIAISYPSFRADLARLLQ